MSEPGDDQRRPADNEDEHDEHAKAHVARGRVRKYAGASAVAQHPCSRAARSARQLHGALSGGGVPLAALSTRKEASVV